MPEEDTYDDSPETVYPKTALFVAAATLPVLGWAGKQIFGRVAQVFNGDQDVVSDEEDD